jgi:anti-anti-sigma factor
MAFEATLEMTNGVAKITLTGELDASTAPAFQAEVEKAHTREAKRLVLLTKDLSYIASAGIRVLIFARQKMGADVEVYVVKPQEQVMDTLERTGLQHSVIVVDEYNEAEIEKV